MSEVKPCPFCGSTHTYVLPNRAGGFVAACGNCEARVVRASEADAALHWNTRA